MAYMDGNLALQTQIINENRAFIVEYLDAEDVIDELIQQHLVGTSAGQQLQLVGMSRENKNRIICEQLATAGPGAINKFCKVLRDKRRQIFIAERLEKSEEGWGLGWGILGMDQPQVTSQLLLLNLSVAIMSDCMGRKIWQAFQTLRCLKLVWKHLSKPCNYPHKLNICCSPNQ